MINKTYSEVINRQLTEVRPGFVMENLNFKAKRGELTAIIGKVASGKSSLLRALIGEIPIYMNTEDIKSSNMRLKVNGSVSYICQTAFLITGSVKSNILMDLEYDKKKMDFAIKYSALESTVKEWEEGLDKSCGEDGNNLSGG